MPHKVYKRGKKGWHATNGYLRYGDNRVPKVWEWVRFKKTFGGDLPELCYQGMHAEPTAFLAASGWGYGRSTLDEVRVRGYVCWGETGTKFCGEERKIVRRLHACYLKLAFVAVYDFNPMWAADLRELALTANAKDFDEIVELAFWLQETIEGDDG